MYVHHDGDYLKTHLSQRLTHLLTSYTSLTKEQIIMCKLALMLFSPPACINGRHLYQAFGKFSSTYYRIHLNA